MFVYPLGNDESTISVLEKAIQWENGLSGLGRLKQIFLSKCTNFQAKKSKKIRFNLPNPPNPFSHCIGIFQSGNCG
jgi:hypothetical protein